MLAIIKLLTLLTFIHITKSLPRNNVCKSLEDYYTIATNPNCWYDYITDMEMPELMAKSGRPFERYNLVTPDGYILSLFRIPNTKSAKKRKSPVFLQHGLVATAKHWVSLGNDSLAFQLNDNGYDVWLGNYRGTKYSESHTSLSVNDEAYWEHTLDDISLIDLPMMLDKVVEVTRAKSNVIYVGHSLGGTMALMYASDQAAKAKKHIKSMVLVAPGYKLSHMLTPLRKLAKYADLIWNTAKSQNLLSISSQGAVSGEIINFLCFKSPKLMYACIELFGYIYGPRTYIKPNQYPSYLKQQLTGSSLKIVYQVTSFIKGIFTKFDYGLNNTYIYGQNNVPNYNVSKIDIQTTIITSKNDWLTPFVDALELATDMNKKYLHDVITMRDDVFNHMDYMFGSRAKELFVDVVMGYINNFDTIAH